MRAFLTGGSGFVGGHVARALAARGCEVRCLVRGGRGALEGLDVETVAGDLLDADALRRGMHGCRVVYHCAADYRLFVPDPEAIYAANVDGTRNVLRAAAESGADRVVYTSTVGALGIRGDGSPADETTPVRLADMVGHYKRSKFLAERIADEWVARGLPVVVVNPTAPVGERDVKPTATGTMIVDFLNRRMSAYVDTGLNLVDVRDVAAGHLLAAERGRPGERYILGRENLTLRQIGELLSELTGIPAPRVRLPRWLPLVFAAVDTAVSRAIGREPYVPLDAVRLARHRMFFDASKAVRDLGLPQTPVREALCRAVDWFRRHGHVRRRAA